MRRYKTTGIVDIFGGLVGLDDKQAAARRINVSKVEGKDGVYEIIHPIQFKTGETVRLEKPDKALLALLEDIDKAVDKPEESKPELEAEPEPAPKAKKTASKKKG